MLQKINGFLVLFVAWVCLLGLVRWLPLLAQTPTNPTRITDATVMPPVTQFTVIRVLTSTGWVLVQPDATIKIDLVAKTIGAVLPLVVAAPVEKVDQWVVPTAGQASFVLASVPATGTPVKVYRNGLLQWQSADYSLVGQAVTFLPAQGTSPGDYIQAIYWK